MAGDVIRKPLRDKARVMLMAMLAPMTIAMAPAIAAGIEGQTPHPAARAGDYRYQLFLPRGYASADKPQWPLVIFLHGSGERGTDIETVKANGPPRIIAQHPGAPFLLVSPQLEPGGIWDTARLTRLLADVRKAYRIDPARIYLTGLSLGGHATWRWASERPDLFAAIVPVAGRGDPAAACRLRTMPVWAFHGDNDDIVPPIGSFAMIEAIRACPGLLAPPRLTIYPGANHNSWDAAYDDPALWRWLLEQRRMTPAP